MSEAMETVILDTDIGSDIDDALALAYLLRQPRCRLLGVTTATGEPHLRAEMVSAICRQAGRDDVPIHVGCPEAMLIEMRQRQADQARALGDWSRERFSASDQTAIAFLRDTIRAHPGEITLLAVGPLTNIGVLFTLDPELPSLLKQLVLMCGRFFTAMGGEWNAVGDPHATAVAYGNTHHTRPPRHVSFGLDVTMRCVMTPDACRERFTARVLAPVRDFAEIWFKRASRVTFHDPLAAACIFEPELCVYLTGNVRVSLAEPTLGWTVFDDHPDAPHDHTVAADVDPERFFDHYFGVVAG